MSLSDHQISYEELSLPASNAEQCRQYCNEARIDLSVNAEPLVLSQLADEMGSFLSDEIRHVLREMREKNAPSLVVLKNMFNTADLPPTPGSKTADVAWKDISRITVGAVMGLLGADIRRFSSKKLGIRDAENAFDHIVPQDDKAAAYDDAGSSSVDLFQHMDGAGRENPPDIIALSSLRAGEGGESLAYNSFTSVRLVLDSCTEQMKEILRLQEFRLPYVPHWYQKGDVFPVLSERDQHLLFGNIQGTTNKAKDAYTALIRAVSETPKFSLLPQPGQITIFKNFGTGAVLHGRSAFSAHSDPAKRRWTQRVIGTMY